MLALCITAVLLIVVPDGAGQTVHGERDPFETYLEALTYANAYIDVPAGATSLTVTLTNGSGDLDLYVKYGSPLLGFISPDILSASADFRSEGPTANESITVTPSSTPPLRAGKWYVATLNLNNVRTNFTLTATYQVPGGSTRTGNVPGAGTLPSTPAGSKPRAAIQGGALRPLAGDEARLVLRSHSGGGHTGVDLQLDVWAGTRHCRRQCRSMYLLLRTQGGPFVFLGDQLPGMPSLSSGETSL
ncbi:MAG: PPC domain-containing protein [Desulfobacterales bacterium]|nr:PPC domain-containing protein [Desulfobacterales bacterium]